MKTCTKCGETKDVAAFSLRRRGGEHRRPYCKACALAYNRATYDPARVKNRHLLRTFGITPETRADMEAIQGGMCAICGDGGVLDTDHSHMTGEVRGLLCRRHNLGIGHFDDDPHLLEIAIEYVRSFS